MVHEGASIEGVVTWHELDLHRDFGGTGLSLAGSFVFFLSLAVSAIVLFLIYPHFSTSVVQRLQDAPFKSLGLGLAVLFATPFVVLMLLVSVLGVPLGLIVLGLYFVVLIVGLLVGMIWIGDFGLRRLGKTPDESKWMRAWSIVAVAAILLLIGYIPFIGGLVLFLVLLPGVGALELHFYRLYLARGDVPTSTPAPTD